ncbi:MAG TPA: methyltransferase domain-containing protein [Gaiellaceae bacterium]|jgi:SAM-dependent methyltransferase|nr:methyltransferase domain-containing protein [Gaiellaceae bacterium]
MLPTLHEFRERVIANAEISEGDVVLDVGAGDGLIAFAALERVGPSGRVIFSDVSEDLLDECKRLAAELDALERSEFVRASADALPLEPESVDVVTTRSVLIYLMDKAPAFREFHRVLRGGGRLSIFEPINIFGYEHRDGLYYGLDVSPVQHLADKIIGRRQAPGEHPLLDFDERDLFRFAQEAGFDEVRMDYRAEQKLREWTISWDTFRRSSGNPLDPTPEEEMLEALEPDERVEFEAYVRTAIESKPRVLEWRAGAYLRAVKRLR